MKLLSILLTLFSLQGCVNYADYLTNKHKATLDKECSDCTGHATQNGYSRKGYIILDSDKKVYIYGK